MNSLIYKQGILLSISLLLGISGFCQKATFSIPNKNASKIIKVDLLTLIRNIDQYDNEWIETTGDVTAIFEVFAVVPREQVKFKVSGLPAIWLDLYSNMKVSIPFLDGKTFILRGKINILKKGHLGQYQGTLEKIFYIKQV